MHCCLSRSCPAPRVEDDVRWVLWSSRVEAIRRHFELNIKELSNSVMDSPVNVWSLSNIFSQRLKQLSKILWKECPFGYELWPLSISSISKIHHLVTNQVSPAHFAHFKVIHFLFWPCYFYMNLTNTVLLAHICPHMSCVLAIMPRSFSFNLIYPLLFWLRWENIWNTIRQKSENYFSLWSLMI